MQLTCFTRDFLKQNEKVQRQSDTWERASNIEIKTEHSGCDPCKEPKKYLNFVDSLISGRYHHDIKGISHPNKCTQNTHSRVYVQITTVPLSKTPKV